MAKGSPDGVRGAAKTAPNSTGWALSFPKVSPSRTSTTLLQVRFSINVPEVNLW
jgi:hypothetical protein